MTDPKRKFYFYACSISIFVFWGFLWFQYNYDSKQANTAAETTVSNLSKAFEENILGTIRHLDEFLVTLRRDYPQRQDQIPALIASYNRHSDKELIIQLSIADAHGIMVYNTKGMPEKPLDLSDREHIRVHQVGNADNLFISKPVMGRVSKKWSIQFTRKITNQDGTFAGVAVLSVDPDYFTNFYRSIDIGAKGVITLVGTDGIIRARSSAVTRGVDPVGTLIPTTSTMLDPAKPPVGVYLAPSSVDGISRIASYRRLKSYPLVVFVALAEEEALSVLHWHRTSMILQGLLASAGLLLTFQLALRLNTRQHLFTEELQESRQQLAELNEGLERRVVDEVLKNREKDGILLHQDKLASIGKLAAGVAHEINNPIGFIMSNLGTLHRYSEAERQYLSALEDALKTCSSEEQRSQLEELRRGFDLPYILEDIPILISESLEGAERVKRIVLDLKDFARLDEDSLKETDLNQCVQSSANIVRNEIRYVADIELQLNTIPLIICNPQQINQVIANLLVNAAQAIEGHGRITVSTSHEGDQVLLSVTDTGCGIPADIRDLIFDPFFTTKEVGKGTGLGLSISYDIIRKHGGDITFESEPGVGTTFMIRLPLNCSKEISA